MEGEGGLSVSSMSGEEAEFLDSGVCRDMKAPVGDRDTRRGGNASLMDVIRMTGSTGDQEGRISLPWTPSSLTAENRLTCLLHKDWQLTLTASV